MASLPPSSNPPPNPEKKPEEKKDESSPSSNSEEEKMDTDAPQPEPEETWDDIPEDIMELNTDEILTRIRLFDNDLKVFYSFLPYTDLFLTEL
jgi:26S proteasome regulatory subunit T5